MNAGSIYVHVVNINMREIFAYILIKGFALITISFDSQLIQK